MSEHAEWYRFAADSTEQALFAAVRNLRCDMSRRLSVDCPCLFCVHKREVLDRAAKKPAEKMAEAAR